MVTLPALREALDNVLAGFRGSLAQFFDKIAASLHDQPKEQPLGLLAT